MNREKEIINERDYLINRFYIGHKIGNKLKAHREETFKAIERSIDFCKAKIDNARLEDVEFWGDVIKSLNEYSNENDWVYFDDCPKTYKY